MLVVACDECNFMTKEHYTIKGCRREIRKLGGCFSGGAILCPHCGTAQTLKVFSVYTRRRATR